MFAETWRALRSVCAKLIRMKISVRCSHERVLIWSPLQAAEIWWSSAQQHLAQQRQKWKEAADHRKVERLIQEPGGRMSERVDSIIYRRKSEFQFCMSLKLSLTSFMDLIVFTILCMCIQGYVAKPALTILFGAGFSDPLRPQGTFFGRDNLPRESR